MLRVARKPMAIWSGNFDFCSALLQDGCPRDVRNQLVSSALQYSNLSSAPRMTLLHTVTPLLSPARKVHVLADVKLISLTHGNLDGFQDAESS